MTIEWCKCAGPAVPTTAEVCSLACYVCTVILGELQLLLDIEAFLHMFLISMLVLLMWAILLKKQSLAEWLFGVMA